MTKVTAAAEIPTDPPAVSERLLLRVLQAVSELRSAVSDVDGFNASIGTYARGGEAGSVDDERLNELIARTRLTQIYETLDWAAAWLRDIEGVERLDDAGAFLGLLEQVGAEVGYGGVIQLEPTNW